MSTLKSTLGKSPSISSKNLISSDFDKYDLLVLCRDTIKSSLDDECENQNKVLHKTMMIKSKYIEYAKKLVGKNILRKNAGIGSLFSQLVIEYTKEIARKKKLLYKMKSCFNFILEDTEKMISNKKHARISQYEYYLQQVSKGRDVFKRMYYEYAFEEEDLKEIFNVKELKQVKVWAVSTEESFLLALENWNKVYKKTSKNKVWN